MNDEQRANLWVLAVWITGFWLFMCVLAWNAKGEEHVHPNRPQDIPIHEKFYSNWMRPDMPSQSCCNKTDCAPAEVRRNAYGLLEFRKEGESTWVAFPKEKIEQYRFDQENARESPDGRNHACISPGANYPLCAVLGNGT